MDRQFKAEEAYKKKIAESGKEIPSGEFVTELSVGQRVKHKKFGVGTVSKILGEGMNKTVEIIFDECGMKRLIIAYAKLQEV